MNSKDWSITLRGEGRPQWMKRVPKKGIGWIGVYHTGTYFWELYLYTGKWEAKLASMPFLQGEGRTLEEVQRTVDDMLELIEPFEEELV